MGVIGWFIHRSVATTLIMLGVVLSGILAFIALPVAPLPQVDFPVILVQAQIPGASPETMAASVATPLERSLGAISGVWDMNANMALGRADIGVVFDMSRDINGAARDVMAAINAARSLLPTGMPTNPTYRKLNPADAPIMILALTSETVPRSQMYDLANSVLMQRLSRISGVGQVQSGGGASPSVRVELNPDKLNAYGIGVEQVRTAIAADNPNRPKGFLENAKQHWQILANDQEKTAAGYRPLIVGYKNGAPVRLSDVADVQDSVQDIRNIGLLNGKPAVVMMVFREPGANILDTVARVRAQLPVLQSYVPANVTLSVVMDRTPSIRASLVEVERALVIAVMLVVATVLAFLRNWRAALIPGVAVPVSLMGTFSVMYLAGFSLNIISLMAVTIATGFVVDDAVVVLENITRHMEDGVPPFRAALQGAREVGFTVLSMSLSLIAVFIPILLMGGLVGRIFREFAVTLSAAVLVSMVVSLTLTPMMCAWVLRAEPNRAVGDHANSRWLTAMMKAYERSLDWALRHGGLMMTLLAGVVALNVYLYIAIPKGFFPQQDTGKLMGGIKGDQSISFQAMKGKITEMVKLVGEDPAVQNVICFNGGERNDGRMFVVLKPLAERKVSIDQVMARLRRRMARIAGVKLRLMPVQDLRIGAHSSDSLYQYTLQADDLDLLRTWEPRLRDAMAKLPQLTDLDTDQQDKGAEIYLQFDRTAMQQYGITQRQADNTLNDLFGQRNVSVIYNPMNQYWVVMEAAPAYWQHTDSLNKVFIQSTSGAEVPLSAVARFESRTAPLEINHEGQFVAATISFNLPPGVSLSQAEQAIQQAAAHIGMPESVHGGFQGNAKTFQQSSSNEPLLILAAFLAVYIVLGILYEDLVHPLTILSTLPSAGVGALLALMLFKFDFSLIALIGVILLIGIVKKNAIMMVDFAIVAEREQGLSPRDAIRLAGKLRFRPIMMTTVAASLAALPLALGTGDGAEMRQPLGISIVGGLVLSQLLTLYTTPVVYLYLDHFRLKMAGLWQRRVAHVAASH